MKKATITDFTEDPPKVIATVTMGDGMMFARITSDNDRLVDTLTNQGAYHPRMEKQVFPSDGEVFIEALPFMFSNYVRAKIEE